MQIVRNRTQYDVCIVGSGAGGGMSAMVLSQAGANVVMLEAGPMWDSGTDSAMYKGPYDTQRRGAATKERQFGEFDGGSARTTSSARRSTGSATTGRSPTRT